MQPTCPIDARRPGHEARGEWPQPTLSALADRRAATDGDRVVLIEGRRDGDRVVTFAGLKARADRMAVALRRLGLGQGDVVSWQLPNWVDAAALAIAIDRVGAVSNPIITIYRERELAFVCRQARTRALVVPGVVRGTDHRELARAVQAAAPQVEHLLTLRAEPAAGMHALEALEDDPPAPLGPSPLGPHDVAAIFYTSGTTADPKGVLHTPSTLGAVVHCQRQLHGTGPEDRSLLQFPLPHIGGVVLFVLLPLMTGSSAVYMDTFDPALALDLIERHRVTGAGGPPAVLQAMLAAPNFSPAKVRSVRSSGSGAADVSPVLIRTARERLGAFAYRSYGMTECPLFSSGAPGDPIEKLEGTDGRPVPGAAARVDAEGYLRITGRRKDVIIRKGENLSAKAIEDELAAHPAVADVAVIGVPDPASGERVCACVVLRPGTGGLTLAAVRAFMEARGVMRQKIPEQLELLDALPRNATGKVQKDVLRARLRRDGGGTAAR